MPPRPRRLADPLEKACQLADKPGGGYRRLKRHARQAQVKRMHTLDEAHLDELVDQWFSQETQQLVEAAVPRMKKPAAAPS